MPTFALSTCWCSQRHSDGYAMAKEIAGLGFSHVELSHGIRIILVPGLLRAVEEKIIQVASTHNFCPLPPGINQAAPNLFEPSSRDAREREQWLRYTRRSIEFAAQTGARVMVCHLGSIGFFWFNPAARLRAFIEAEGESAAFQHKEFPERLKRAMAKIRQRMPEYWNHLVASLGEIEALARGKNVRLGFENREKVEEMPLDPDFEALFAAVGPNTQGGYWHDTGHAELKQRHGLLDHRAHLSANASRLLGFHLHDVDAAGDDHQSIGAGNIDFEMISTFWRPEHLLVLELAPRVTTEEVVSSKQRIEALMAARGLSVG